MCTGNSTEGSNPSLSAIFQYPVHQCVIHGGPTNPPTGYLAAINGDAEFKDLELLSPNDAQIQGLIDGQPVK